MTKKHKKRNAQRRTLKFEERKAKCRKWIAEYEGSNIVKAYRKHFKVDRMTAYNELKKLGYEFSDDEVQRVMKAEEDHQRALARRREEKRQRELERLYENSDDTFFYIVGYTSGGAPYGVTWEEMGLQPYQYFDDSDYADNDNEIF